jgi:hypothetical protein
MANHEISTSGRYRGKLTSRPLPADRIAGLSLSDCERLAESWSHRGAMERRVVDAFMVVRDALVSLRAHDALVSLAERAIDDERRHAELCRVVASRFAGRDVPEPPRLVLHVPKHEGAGDELRHVLHVLGHCAINETFASAVLEQSLRDAKGALARAALRELLADEIDHARVGFGLVATLSPETKQTLSMWLPGLIRASVVMWRTTVRPDTEEPALNAHGMISPSLIERAIITATREILVPGFAHLGVDSAGVTVWLDAGAP